VVNVRKKHDHNAPRLDDAAVAKCTLDGMGQEQFRRAFDRKDFLVRLINDDDWVQLGVYAPRARNTRLPFNVKMTLPIVVDSEERIIAVPHLGVNFRPELQVTVVLMPIHRSLPADVDAGYDLPDMSYYNVSSVEEQRHRQSK